MIVVWGGRGALPPPQEKKIETRKKERSKRKLNRENVKVFKAERCGGSVCGVER